MLPEATLPHSSSEVPDSASILEKETMTSSASPTVAVFVSTHHAKPSASDLTATIHVESATALPQLGGASAISLGIEMPSDDVHFNIDTIKTHLLEVWKAKKNDPKSTGDFLNAQLAKATCDKLTRFVLANVAAALQSLKSLLVPEREDISHAFYALCVAVQNDSGGLKTFKEVADIKHKLQC